MHSPGVGPTNQPGSPLYPATFRNMAPYEDAYLDQDMAYPILEPPPHDPFVETANMLPEIVPLSEQVSDDSSPLSDHAASADGCNGEDSDDTSPFAKLPTPAEVLADKDNKGSSAGDVGIMAKAVQRDIKEPQRPLSAYALYFRDTQASIKLQNPHASFGEVSQIVASMWKGLEPEHKLVYKRKTKVAKMEYRRAIAEHRSRLSMNSAADQLDISRRSGYMSSPPGAMSTPPRDSMSPLQNSNPLLSSAMDDGSPRDYMDVASPEDVLSTQQQQQRQQPPMALNSLSMFQKPKQASVIPTDCCPQQMGMNSLRASAPCCASDRKPERSPSLCNQTSGCGAGMPNNQWRMPVITFTRCRRSGCPNPPVPSHEWDVEYCSSECVILHCKNVFSGWAAQRQIADRLLPQ